MTPEKNEESSLHLAKAAVKGASWTYVAYYSGKLVVFLTTIFLARLLTKTDFGIVGYVVTVIGFLDVVKDLGVSASLIYYNEDRVVPTAFWLSMITNVSFFILAWVGAPLVGDFFHDDRVIWVTRVMAFNFPLGAFGATHEALLIRKLAFSRKFIPDFSRAISKGLISIPLAYAGFGPWSIILGQVGGTFISTIILWRLVDWRPSFSFSPEIAKSLLSFGVPLVGMNIISVFVLNVDYLLVGRYLGAEALGVYTLAFRVPEMTVLQLCNIVAQVIFPVFATIRHDSEALGRGFLKTARYVALITVPAGVGMALLAEPIVLVFLGEKWIEVVPVMRAIALYSAFISLGYNAGDVYKAQGKPGILTVLSLIQVTMLVPALYWAVTVQKSVVAVGWVQATLALVGSAIYLTVAIRLLRLQPLRLLGSFVPAIGSSLGMATLLLLLLHLINEMSAIAKLTLGALLGVIFYLMFLRLFGREVFSEGLSLAKTFFNKRKQPVQEV
jgi:PST family polysaccharide transporter